MSFHFATCDRRKALEFLQQLYPNSQVSDTEGSAAELLNWVEKDIVRVQDPSCHNPASIIPATNWDEAHRAEVFLVARRFHSDAMASRVSGEAAE